jgi:hypothetical protein
MLSEHDLLADFVDPMIGIEGAVYVIEPLTGSSAAAWSSY